MLRKFQFVSLDVSLIGKYPTPHQIEFLILMWPLTDLSDSFCFFIFSLFTVTVHKLYLLGPTQGQQNIWVTLFVPGENVIQNYF